MSAQDHETVSIYPLDDKQRDGPWIISAFNSDIMVRGALKVACYIFKDCHPIFVTSIISLSSEEAQRREHTYNLFLTRFAAAANTVLWSALQFVAINQSRWRCPHVIINVEIEMLQGGRHDQVFAATENAAGLRSAQHFATGIGHEICPFSDEAFEI